MNQKGFATPIILIFLLTVGIAFYLGLKAQNLNFSPFLSPTKSVQSSPTESIPSPSVPKPTIGVPTKASTASADTQPFDYEGYFKGMYPKGVPVYPGAKMADYNDGGAGNMGPCMEELLKSDPKCLRVKFKFIKDLKDASVEQIVNWYVSNPASGWTYRGVYGDQRQYQFGDIYNKSVYYRMEFRNYSTTEKGEADIVEIYYDGPYPISNLSPKP